METSQSLDTLAPPEETERVSSELSPTQETFEERYARATSYQLSGVELESILFACHYSHSDFARKFFNIVRPHENSLSQAQLKEAKRILSRTDEAPPRITWTVSKLVQHSTFERLAQGIINNPNRPQIASLEELVINRIHKKGTNV